MFEEITEIPAIANCTQECSGALMAVKDALYVLSGKWKLPLILTLSEGPMRFKDLQRAVGDITPRILTKELRELEMNEFVIRKAITTRPVTVTYELTPYSKTLDAVMTELRKWGLQHRERIIASRRNK